MATSLVDQINDGFKRLYAKRADKPEYNDEFATTCNDNGIYMRTVSTTYSTIIVTLLLSFDVRL